MLRRKRSNSPTARRKQNKLSSDKSDKACQHFWRLSQSSQSRPCRKSTSLAIFHQDIGMAWPPLMTDTIIENPWSKSIIHKIKRIILPTSPVFFKHNGLFYSDFSESASFSVTWAKDGFHLHGLICTRKTRIICCFIFPDQKSHGLRYV